MTRGIEPSLALGLTGTDTLSSAPRVGELDGVSCATLEESPAETVGWASSTVDWSAGRLLISFLIGLLTG